MIYKGLALAVPSDLDLHALGAAWYYSWTPSPPFSTDVEFVPMLWGGNPSEEIPADYAGDLLFLNEPNIATQANVRPAAAVDKLAVVRARYPRARIIGCGTSIWCANSWVKEFIEAGGRVDAWHIHAYIESWITPRKVIDYAKQYHDLTGGTYWISEYGSMTGNVDELRTVTEWFTAQPWVERIAAYTNRQPIGVPWAVDRRVEMVREDGGLSPVGEYYAGVQATKTVHTVYMPVVSSN